MVVALKPIPGVCNHKCMGRFIADIVAAIRDFLIYPFLRPPVPVRVRARRK